MLDQPITPLVSICELAKVEFELETYLRWLQNVEENRFIETARTDYTMVDLQRYLDSRTQTSQVKFWGIFLNSEIFIGTIKLEPIDLYNQTAWLGMMIGDACNRGKGYGSQALNQVLKYAVTVLNLRKIFLGVNKENYPAIKMYKNAGFTFWNSNDVSLIMKKDFNTAQRT